ncbi:MAG: hypothetical protein JWM05_3709, partial [Acidimicrobiales bacterium]|nr:hypothetical protein [Acidimicrobiales bacterium]
VTRLARTTVAPAGRDRLATIASNGGWCWFQDERSIFTSDGRLLVSSVADLAGTHGTARDGATQVSSYELSSGRTWTDTINIGQVSDDHNAAALIELPSKRLYAMWTGHSQAPYIYRGYQDPTDLEFNRQPRLYRPEAAVYDPNLEGGRASGVTYSNLAFLADENGGKGRLYDFFRSRGERPHVAYSNDQGVTWHDGGELFDKYRAYVRYKSDGHGRIWFITTDGHPTIRDGTSLYGGYIEGGRVYGPDGHDAGPMGGSVDPVDLGPAGLIAKGVPGTPAVEVDYWGADIELDPTTGRPVVTFSNRHPGTPTVAGKKYVHDAFTARWTGAAWSVARLGFGGDELYAGVVGPQPDYTGLSAIDPSNPNRVFLSTDVHPATGVPLTSAADGKVHFEIFEGTSPDAGMTWTWTAVTHDSSSDNIRPIIPVPRDGHWALLWLKGSYPDFFQYDLDVVGIVDPPTGPHGPPVPLPTRPPALGYQRSGQAVVAGDFDGNGRGDLYLNGSGTQESSEVQLLARGRRRSIETRRSLTTDAVPIAGDFNGDGRTDTFLYTAGPAPDAVRFHTADGNYDTVAQRVDGTYRPASGDFNGDGFDDIAWHAPGGHSSVWFGSSNGRFMSVPLAVGGSFQPVVGDFDGNGRADILWYAPGRAQDMIWFMQPDGSVIVRSVRVDGAYRPVVGDFDGNGRDDVLWMGPGAAPDSVWLANRDGSFRHVATSISGDYRAASADFDGDHKDDVAFTGGSGAVQFWYGSATFPSSH